MASSTLSPGTTKLKTNGMNYIYLPGDWKSKYTPQTKDVPSLKTRSQNSVVKMRRQNHLVAYLEFFGGPVKFKKLFARNFFPKRRGTDDFSAAILEGI